MGSKPNLNILRRSQRYLSFETATTAYLVNFESDMSNSIRYQQESCWIEKKKRKKRVKQFKIRSESFSVMCEPIQQIHWKDCTNSVFCSKCLWNGVKHRGNHRPTMLCNLGNNFKLLVWKSSSTGILSS